MYDSKMCFVLEPRPDHSEAAAFRDKLTVDELLGRVNENGRDGNTPFLPSADPAYFGGTLYSVPSRPIDSGRSKWLLDWTFSNIIHPAVDGRGFRITRSSALSMPEYLTRPHLSHLEEADLVIADLSMNDPVVAYCVALRTENAKSDMILLRDMQTANIFDIFGPFDSVVRYAAVPSDAAAERAKADATPAAQAALLQKMVGDPLSDLTRQVKHFLDKHAQAGSEKADGPSDQAESHAKTAAEAASRAQGADQKVNLSIDDLARVMREVLVHQEPSDSVERIRKRLIRNL
jgi:hypothetical protein